ncbi:MAG: universal stress protein [Oceanospirillaceae bacterium]
MYKHILIPIDLSHKSEALELLAISSKLADESGATLHILYVDPSLIHRSSYPHLDQANYHKHCEEALSEIAELIAELPDNLQGISHSRQGTVHDQILNVAKKEQVDAIVMMAKKPGLSSYFIGSNSERVVRHAKCSVFITRSVNDKK